jgi:hypothetical protein
MASGARSKGNKRDITKGEWGKENGVQGIRKEAVWGMRCKDRSAIGYKVQGVGGKERKQI